MATVTKKSGTETPGASKSARANFPVTENLDSRYRISLSADLSPDASMYASD